MQARCSDCHCCLRQILTDHGQFLLNTKVWQQNSCSWTLLVYPVSSLLFQKKLLKMTDPYTRLKISVVTTQTKKWQIVFDRENTGNYSNSSKLTRQIYICVGWTFLEFSLQLLQCFYYQLDTPQKKISQMWHSSSECVNKQKRKQLVCCAKAGPLSSQLSDHLLPPQLPLISIKTKNC